ncbi:MAG: 2'-deoxycytidine 5'-triphosphate deaminase [Rhodobacteraceae bacterium]|nr:2'-deoxycytidine 5'-triphosphate deaminase [Paracoccaceae bacterium]
MTTGVLPFQAIEKMIEAGHIRADIPIPEGQIQPASLDLRLGTRAWRVRASFLPGKAGIATRLDDFSMHEIDLSEGVVLEKGCVYLVELMESLSLPTKINAVANAKSSTGRLDLFTRLITEHATEFDRIDAGYHGRIFAEISPRSFSVLVRPGMRLNQIRFREGQVVLDDPALRALNATEGLVDEKAHIDDGLGFSVDLSKRENGVVGYRAKPHTGLIDLDKLAHYPMEDFWEPVQAPNGRIILDPGAFYILVSREAVHIPPEYAAEMAPYLAMVGEFRVHYAGFFDPGFGNENAGGKGSRGVLEVRCHEAPFALEHGQIVGRLVFERMQAVPKVLYGADLGSNYQGQGLKLSKHFRM